MELSPRLSREGSPRTKSHFAARYRERKHPMYGTPLSELPWRLVVFEEREGWVRTARKAGGD